jgi:hypothetical protein
VHLYSYVNGDRAISGSGDRGYGGFEDRFCVWWWGSGTVGRLVCFAERVAGIGSGDGKWGGTA